MRGTGRVRRLDPAKITQTCQVLSARIAERFPESGLAAVARDVQGMSESATRLGDWLERPIVAIRALVGVAVGLIVLVVAALIAALPRHIAAFSSLADLMQGFDAAVNELTLLGVALFFLVTWETRLKRHRALAALHALRSLAHVVDMHQLTKDPSYLANRAARTASSPARALSGAGLSRYLDYCSELVALISKIAALHVQCFDDGVTLNAVGDIEVLCAGLSQKIWQKLVILDRAAIAEAFGSRVASP